MDAAWPPDVVRPFAACPIAHHPQKARYAFSSVRGTDGDDTFAGSSNGPAVLWRGGRLVDLGVGDAVDVNRTGAVVLPLISAA